MKHGTRYVGRRSSVDVRSRDAMTIKIDLHGYIWSNFYEYGALLCSALRPSAARELRYDVLISYGDLRRTNHEPPTHDD